MLVVCYRSAIVSMQHQTMERQITQGHMVGFGVYTLITCPLKSCSVLKNILSWFLTLGKSKPELFQDRYILYGVRLVG